MSEDPFVHSIHDILLAVIEERRISWEILATAVREFQRRALPVSPAHMSVEHNICQSDHQTVRWLHQQVAYLLQRDAQTTAKRQKQEAKSRSKFSQPIKDTMWDLARGMCVHCGLPLDKCASNTAPNKPHFDHVTPRALVDDNSLSNCQLLCAQCNLKKGKLVRDWRSDWLKTQIQRLEAEWRKRDDDPSQLDLLGEGGEVDIT